MALPVGHLLRGDGDGAVGLEHRPRGLARQESAAAAGMIASWKSGGPGAASMKVANPNPRQRPSPRAASCCWPAVELGELERASRVVRADMRMSRVGP